MGVFCSSSSSSFPNIKEVSLNIYFAKVHLYMPVSSGYFLLFCCVGGFFLFVHSSSVPLPPSHEYPDRDLVKNKKSRGILRGDLQGLGIASFLVSAALLVLRGPPRAVTLRGFPGRAMILAASPQSGWVLWMSPRDCVLVL